MGRLAVAVENPVSHLGMSTGPDPGDERCRDNAEIDSKTAQLTLWVQFPLGRALISSKLQVRCSPSVFFPEERQYTSSDFKPVPRALLTRKQEAWSYFGLQNGSRNQTHLHVNIFAVSGAAEMLRCGLLWFHSGFVMKYVAWGGVH